MAPRKTVFSPGGYCHIYNRGANRQPIFNCADNYVFLLRRVKQCVVQCQITVIAYCLMPNHYHFVLRQDSEHPVSQFVQSLFNSYTKAFNKVYARSGTLFEGPFRAVPIDDETYLLHACRYVHRNPLEAGLVTDVADWPYTNYLEWIGQRNGALVDREFVQSYFATPAAYARFVMEVNPPRRIDRAIRKIEA